MIDEKTPVIILIYQHITKNKKNSTEEAMWIQSVVERGFSGIPSTSATEAERHLLLEILTVNSRLLPDDFRPQKVDEEKDFKLSCLMPVGPLSFEDLAHLNADQGCALCGGPTKMRCAQCQSVSYCSKGAFIEFS